MSSVQQSRSLPAATPGDRDRRPSRDLTRYRCVTSRDCEDGAVEKTPTARRKKNREPSTERGPLSVTFAGDTVKTTGGSASSASSPHQPQQLQPQQHQQHQPHQLLSSPSLVSNWYTSPPQHQSNIASSAATPPVISGRIPPKVPRIYSPSVLAASIHDRVDQRRAVETAQFHFAAAANVAAAATHAAPPSPAVSTPTSLRAPSPAATRVLMSARTGAFGTLERIDPESEAEAASPGQKVEAPRSGCGPLPKRGGQSLEPTASEACQAERDRVRAATFDDPDFLSATAPIEVSATETTHTSTNGSVMWPPSATEFARKQAARPARNEARAGGTDKGGSSSSCCSIAGGGLNAVRAMAMSSATSVGQSESDQESPTTVIQATGFEGSCLACLSALKQICSIANGAGSSDCGDAVAWDEDQDPWRQLLSSEVDEDGLRCDQSPMASTPGEDSASGCPGYAGTGGLDEDMECFRASDKDTKLDRSATTYAGSMAASDKSMLEKRQEDLSASKERPAAAHEASGHQETAIKASSKDLLEGAVWAQSEDPNTVKAVETDLAKALEAMKDKISSLAEGGSGSLPGLGEQPGWDLSCSHCGGVYGGASRVAGSGGSCSQSGCLMCRSPDLRSRTTSPSTSPPPGSSCKAGLSLPPNSAHIDVFPTPPSTRIPSYSSQPTKTLEPPARCPLPSKAPPRAKHPKEVAPATTGFPPPSLCGCGRLEGDAAACRRSDSEVPTSSGGHGIAEVVAWKSPARSGVTATALRHGLSLAETRTCLTTADFGCGSMEGPLLPGGPGGPSPGFAKGTEVPLPDRNSWRSSAAASLPSAPRLFGPPLLNPQFRMQDVSGTNGTSQSDSDRLARLTRPLTLELEEHSVQLSPPTASAPTQHTWLNGPMSQPPTTATWHCVTDHVSPHSEARLSSPFALPSSSSRPEIPPAVTWSLPPRFGSFNGGTMPPPCVTWQGDGRSIPHSTLQSAHALHSQSTAGNAAGIAVPASSSLQPAAPPASSLPLFRFSLAAHAPVKMEATSRAEAREDMQMMPWDSRPIDESPQKGYPIVEATNSGGCSPQSLTFRSQPPAFSLTAPHDSESLSVPPTVSLPANAVGPSHRRRWSRWQMQTSAGIDQGSAETCRSAGQVGSPLEIAAGTQLLTHEGVADNTDPPVEGAQEGDEQEAGPVDAPARFEAPIIAAHLDQHQRLQEDRDGEDVHRAAGVFPGGRSRCGAAIHLPERVLAPAHSASFIPSLPPPLPPPSDEDIEVSQGPGLEEIDFVAENSAMVGTPTLSSSTEALQQQDQRQQQQQQHQHHQEQPLPVKRSESVQLDTQDVTESASAPPPLPPSLAHATDGPDIGRCASHSAMVVPVPESEGDARTDTDSVGTVNPSQALDLALAVALIPQGCSYQSIGDSRVWEPSPLSRNSQIPAYNNQAANQPCTMSSIDQNSFSSNLQNSDRLASGFSNTAAIATASGSPPGTHMATDLAIATVAAAAAAGTALQTGLDGRVDDLLAVRAEVGVPNSSEGGSFDAATSAAANRATRFDLSELGPCPAGTSPSMAAMPESPQPPPSAARLVQQQSASTVTTELPLGSVVVGGNAPSLTGPAAAPAPAAIGAKQVAEAVAAGAAAASAPAAHHPPPWPPATTLARQGGAAPASTEVLGSNGKSQLSVVSKDDLTPVQLSLPAANVRDEGWLAEIHWGHMDGHNDAMRVELEIRAASAMAAVSALLSSTSQSTRGPSSVGSGVDLASGSLLAWAPLLEEAQEGDEEGDEEEAEEACEKQGGAAAGPCIVSRKVGIAGVGAGPGCGKPSGPRRDRREQKGRLLLSELVPAHVGPTLEPVRLRLWGLPQMLPLSVQVSVTCRVAGEWEKRTLRPLLLLAIASDNLLKAEHVKTATLSRDDSGDAGFKLCQRSLRVVELNDKATSAGLCMGDVITAVGTRQISTITEYQASAWGQHQLLLTVKRTDLPKTPRDLVELLTQPSAAGTGLWTGDVTSYEGRMEPKNAGDTGSLCAHPFEQQKNATSQTQGDGRLEVPAEHDRREAGPDTVEVAQEAIEEEQTQKEPQVETAADAEGRNIAEEANEDLPLPHPPVSTQSFAVPVPPVSRSWHGGTTRRVTAGVAHVLQVARGGTARLALGRRRDQRIS